MSDSNVVDMDAKRPGFRMSLEFDSEPSHSPAEELARGVEFGALDAHLSYGPITWTATMQAANAEMVKRIAERRGYKFQITYYGDGLWMHVEFVRVTP